jgi:hypothetical protein
MAYTNYADAKAAYLANADYDVTSDAAKARLFLVACRSLLFLMGKRSRTGANQEIEIDPTIVQTEMQRAIDWLSVNSSVSSSAAASPDVILPDFHSFRG